MNREEIFLEVMRRYNNGEGTIINLVKEYPNYTRDKFNLDVKKRHIVKDSNTNLYIYNDLIEGQLDIVEIAPGTKEVIKEVAAKEIKKDSLSDTKVKEVEQDINGSSTRKKKTFEIDVDLEQLIRVAAGIENITINDYVNRVLRDSIPLNVKTLIKG